MSLHFVIDGYNLIKQTSVLNKINLEDSREALIRFLKISRPQGNNPVTVVFDGIEGGFYCRDISGIEVIFSSHQSADDKIKRMVERSPNPKNMVVVTNDREIRSFAQAHLSQIKKVEEFLAKVNPLDTTRARHAGVRPYEDNKILSPQKASEITEEMKKVWLKQ